MKMKMKKSLLLILPLAVMLIVSCNKDQKVVNDLEGSWKVTSEIENGVALPDSAYNTTVYQFEKCKVKNGACPGTVTEDGKAFSFTYAIQDKGETMIITMLGISSTSEILEHTKTKFRWRTADGTSVTETTIEKN